MKQRKNNTSNGLLQFIQPLAQQKLVPYHPLLYSKMQNLFIYKQYNTDDDANKEKKETNARERYGERGGLA
eukprot:15297874-Ditylum_brightwellii.AAC.1